MKVRRGDLHPHRRRKTEPAVQRDSPEAEARHQEQLPLAGILFRFVKGRVCLQFWPQFPRGVALESRVPLELPADPGEVSGGKALTHRGLLVEPTPALAQGQGRRHERQPYGSAATKSAKPAAHSLCFTCILP